MAQAATTSQPRSIFGHSLMHPRTALAPQCRGSGLVTCDPSEEVALISGGPHGSNIQWGNMREHTHTLKRPNHLVHLISNNPQAKSPRNRHTHHTPSWVFFISSKPNSPGATCDHRIHCTRLFPSWVCQAMGGAWPAALESRALEKSESKQIKTSLNYNSTCRIHLANLLNRSLRYSQRAVESKLKIASPEQKC